MKRSSSRITKSARQIVAEKEEDVESDSGETICSDHDSDASPPKPRHVQRVEDPRTTKTSSSRGIRGAKVSNLDLPDIQHIQGILQDVQGDGGTETGIRARKRIRRGSEFRGESHVPQTSVRAGDDSQHAGPLEEGSLQRGGIQWGERCYARRPRIPHQHWYPPFTPHVFSKRFLGHKSSQAPQIERYSSERIRKGVGKLPPYQATELPRESEEEEEGETIDSESD